MINVFKNVQIVMIKIIHLFHFQIIIHVLIHVVQLKKMDNNLKILGIKIIEKKCVQMNQYVHQQHHPGHIKINIIEVYNVTLTVAENMLIN